MRTYTVLLASAVLIAGVPAYAADALKFGAAPSWVVPQAIPADVKPTDAPFAVLLSDQQIALDPGKVTFYHHGALRIQTPLGLAAANVTVVWDPATETVTVNELHIIRGSKVIDVLASGQTFTTLRRETNLDAATLDGTLTATLQPEDLQVGDVIEIATTIARADPILKTHSQASFADWNSAPINFAFARVSWPESMNVSFKQWPGLPEARKSVRDGRVVMELAAHDLEPIVSPKGAPLRFQISRAVEASDFGSWDQVSQLMLPLFEKAAVIPPSGPLHDEVEKIRAATKDPKTRAEQALALVENRVRYVALEMGQGGYVPALPETTWSRRFGDCKAKSALLLAILQSFGIHSEPVLVHASAGDVIADDLPMLDFNHVIVRAHINGKTYWLDGTREGDTSLEDIPVPDFGWVLPLTANAALVHLVPPPLNRPSQERYVDVDASAGLYAPANVSIQEIYRGDSAVSGNNEFSSATAQQRDEALREDGKDFFDTFELASSSVEFDKAKRELTVTMKGTAKLGWKDGWFDVPTSSIAFDPDFERPAGPHQDAPFIVNHPRFAKDIATIRLPVGVAPQEKLHPAVSETLAGVEYARTETVNGDTLMVESSERSLVPEVSYKDAIAAADRLRSLAKDDIYLESPGGYVSTDADLTALEQQTPSDEWEYDIRGKAFLDHGKAPEAIDDLTHSLASDPKNQWALQRRAQAYVAAAEYDKALADTETALSAGDKDPDLRLLRANIFMLKGDRDAVSREADQLVKENPTSDFAFVAAARSYAALGQRDKAMQLFDRAMALKPTALIYINRSQVRPPADIAGKMADLDEALKLEPGNSDALELKAWLLERAGKYRDAVAAYDQLIKASTPAVGSIELRANRAVALYKSGRSADAENAFAELQANTKAAVELNDLCWIQATAGILLDSALNDCQQALKLSPDTGQYLDSLGMVLLKLGKLDEALDAYTKAIAKGTGADSLLGRAFVYERKGDKAHADADAAAARKLYPDIDSTFADYGLKFDRPADHQAAVAKTEAKPVAANAPAVKKIPVVSVTAN